MKAATVPVEAPRAGKVESRELLKWLREDGVISAADAEHTARRFAGGHSAQHPLVRIGAAAVSYTHLTLPTKRIV